MHPFLGGSGPRKELTRPYASIPRGVAAKIIGAALFINSYKGLDPRNNLREPMPQFLGGSRPPQ